MPARSTPPRSFAGKVESVQTLTILDGVHRPEETVVGIRHKLAPRYQPRKRLLHEFVAGLDPIEDLAVNTKKPPLILMSEVLMSVTESTVPSSPVLTR